MKCKCKICGYEWEPHNEKLPTLCARKSCRSAYWYSGKPKGVECRLCGYKWTPVSSKEPTACPGCHSELWNREEMDRVKMKTGDIYGYLTVLEPITSPPNGENGNGYCLIKCKCGNIKKIRRNALYTGNTKSCGCLRIGILTAMSIKHGKTRTQEYICWMNMKRRCFDKNNSEYHNYGGRGIKVCDRWLNSFENFLEDMGKLPFRGATLDRINVNGGYGPNNCRWATMKEQANNTRRSHFITYNGKTKTLSGWADEIGVNYSALENRIRRGWGIEKALTAPIRETYYSKNRTFELFGTRKTASEWARLSPMSTDSFLSRLRKGWELTQALVFPPMPIGKTYSDYIRKVNKIKGEGNNG